MPCSRARTQKRRELSASTSGTATVSLPSAVVPAAVPTDIAPDNTGGGGRPQQMCDNMGEGCHNHKVLDCSYGLCGPCCAAIIRDPRCVVAKHYRKNTHK